MLTNHIKRLLVATFVGGVVASSQLIAPVAANAAPVATVCQYPSKPKPSISVVPSADRPSRVAIATITVPGGLSGIATLKIRPGANYTVYIDHGKGVQAFKTKPDKSYTLSARFVPSGCGAAGPRGTAAYTAPDVAGEEASTDDPSNGGTNRSGTGSVLGTEGSASTSAGALGGTGADLSTEMLGLLGLGLVGAGTASIIVNRRRTRTA